MQILIKKEVNKPDFWITTEIRLIILNKEKVANTIESVRNELENAIDTNDNDKLNVESLLELSQKLDSFILQYIKDEKKVK